MIRRYLLIAFTGLTLASGLSFADQTVEEEKPVVQNPIPPVNVDMKAEEPEASAEAKPAKEETARHLPKTRWVSRSLRRG
jgi:hypothetical protein